MDDALKATAGDAFFIWKLTQGALQLVGEVYLGFLNRRFLTIGFTGTGKTQLLRAVTSARIQDDPRNPTIETKTGLATIGNTRLVVADTAGNPLAFERIVRSEIEKAQAGQYLGILNVTAFGYNETRGGRPNDRHDIKPYLNDTSDVNPAYLDIERQQELDFLDLWLNVAAATGRIGWIFCAMNKYDLWREQKDKVEAYYGPTGPYGRRIIDAFGIAFEARYETCSVSAVLSNFHGRTPSATSDYSQHDATDLNAIFRARFEHRVKTVDKRV